MAIGKLHTLAQCPSSEICTVVGTQGRLAVDRRFTGEGLGKVLLYDAVERTRRAEIACYAVIVDAKDEKARNFYISFGFEPLKVSRLKLFFVL